VPEVWNTITALQRDEKLCIFSFSGEKERTKEKAEAGTILVPEGWKIEPH